MLVLGRLSGIGPVRLRALLDRFPDLPAVRRATPRELSAVPGITPARAASLRAFLGSTELAAAERDVDVALSALAALGGAALALGDPAYPPHLAATYDPPPVLFVLGSVAACASPCIAVVGTRRPTPYGLAAAEHFAREFALAGAVVVSGLARGIDTRAHRAALEAGGRTVAVVGTGLDRCYPAENRRLMESIVRSGAVVSEYLPGTAAEPGHFPRRNRIISGLSLGVVVAESAEDGGAMITARSALDQDRDVFAVPGPIHVGRSRGCHALIRRGGARLAAGAAEVLEDLGHPFGAPANAKETAPDPLGTLSNAERAVLGLLAAEPVQIDELSGQLELPVADLLVALLTLEMNDLVRQLPGKNFVRRF